VHPIYDFLRDSLFSLFTVGLVVLFLLPLFLQDTM
jgi:hypothetical protein